MRSVNALDQCRLSPTSLNSRWVPPAAFRYWQPPSALLPRAQVATPPQPLADRGFDIRFARACLAPASVTAGQTTGLVHKLAAGDIWERCARYYLTRNFRGNSAVVNGKYLVGDYWKRKLSTFDQPITAVDYLIKLPRQEVDDS